MGTQLIWGVVFGIGFGTYYSMACRRSGKVAAMGIFLALPIFYVGISHGLDKLFSSLGPKTRCFAPLFLMPSITYFGLVSITPRRYEVLYRIFQYSEPDPLGPAYLNFIFLVFMTMLSFVIELVRAGLYR